MKQSSGNYGSKYLRFGSKVYNLCSACSEKGVALWRLFRVHFLAFCILAPSWVSELKNMFKTTPIK